MISKNPIDIIEIKSDADEVVLGQETRNSLKSKSPSFHPLLLWDEQGLKYFEAITYAPEYYLTDCEIELLEKHSDEIAQALASDSVLVELGSGCLRKVKILLEAIERSKKHVDYYALDLDRSELERTLRDIKPEEFQYVRCHGLFGSYDDGLDWLRSSAMSSKPRCIMSLGSTLGGFDLPESAKFLSQFANLPGPPSSDGNSTLMLIGLDGCLDGKKVWSAYNDSEHRNERFIRNVMTHANRVLGQEIFRQEDWEHRGKWNAELKRHEQYLIPKKDVDFEGHCLRAGEEVFVVASQKYGAEERETLWQHSGLRPLKEWHTQSHGYGLHLMTATHPN
ncbi:hypothetical protein LTR10_020807 [Elasticomyces elasticus]|uniref:4-dimethylallyltryptophan N-methyltransferase n=1 Tax=Exophiala sideris TaxID=1016849 RepID=A0ABR0JHL2_9EURO|nr:hypothetical protein LTR10_020807 [Elasticomyces elasticus]KAK5034089.1 hypothetical protein LTS07_003009 [Exophiala sideris]KAK5042385.1 hypothetical protein LTR13_001232 [Exophiala sideris]KAK5065466.1 hypothetical protein LTR69_003015 [Exophiala sideris]